MDLTLILNKNSPYFQKVLDILNSEQISKNSYYEIHHIIPKFYFKMKNLPVDNSKKNLIKLTGSNHFLIHYYCFKASLPEFKERFAYACNRMGSQLKKDFDEAILKEAANYFEEIKKEISESKKGTKLSLETKERISKATKGKTKKGHNLDTQTKEKISAAHKGKPLSEEQKAKIGLSHKGKENPYKLTEKRKEQYNKRKGKKVCDRTGSQSYKRRKILKISTGEIFNGLPELAEKLGISTKTLWAGLKYKAQKYNDYKYIEEPKCYKILKISTGEIFLSLKDAAENFGVSPNTFSSGIKNNLPKYRDYKILNDLSRVEC